MVMLVSLDQASEHLKRDTTDDDADLTLKIKAASALVLSELGDAADFLDTDGSVPEGADGNPAGVPVMVQQAVLLQIGCFYSEREAGAAELSATVRALLNLSGRSPRLA